MEQTHGVVVWLQVCRIGPEGRNVCVLVAAAWKNLDFSVAPVTTSITASADHAYAVGLLKSKPQLNGLVDLTTLNSVLKAQWKPAVK